MKNLRAASLALLGLATLTGCGAEWGFDSSPQPAPADTTVYRLSIDVRTDPVVGDLMTVNGRTAAIVLTPAQGTNPTVGGTLPLLSTPPTLAATFQGSENPGMVIDLLVFDAPGGTLGITRGLLLSDAHCRLIAPRVRVETVGPSSVGDHRSTPLYEGVTPSGACRFRRRN